MKEDRSNLVDSIETEPQSNDTPTTSPPPYTLGPSGAAPVPPPPANDGTAYTEELPPPYSPNPNAVINCRVCRAPLTFRPGASIINCSSCHEATAVQPAPPGKKYIRCICHCLLVCSVTSNRVICPRANCRRIISLPSTIVTVVTTATSANSIRAKCGYCETNFVVQKHIAASMLVRCPSCRRVTFVDSQLKSKRVCVFLTIGIIFLILGIAVTATTLALAAGGGFYVVWIGAFVVGIANLIRGGYLSSIRVSQPIQPSA